MKNTYSVAEGQAQFPRVVRQSQNRIVAIERHGRVSAYVIGRERMEAIAETMELLANPGFMAQVRRHRAGKLKFHPLDALAG
jgi:PHD/YefM family antitoxin component YafN of YafNO toxin-antitoxin module